MFSDIVKPMKIEDILRYIVIGGIFTIPFIPLIVANSMFFPFITGKNFTFRILVEIIFGAWMALAFLNTVYRPKFSWLLVSIVSFVGIIFLADVAGENFFKSFWSNFERMEGFVTLIHLLGYFLVAGTFLNTGRLWSKFLNTSVAVSAFVGFYGLMQLAGKVTIHQGGVRLDATFGNATYLAVYMLFHIFITLFLLARWRGGNSVRYVYSAIILLQMVMLYYTATRGSILGFLGGIMLTATIIALFEKERLVLKKIAIGALSVVVLIIGTFFVVKDSDLIKESPVLARFSSISFEETTTKSRFLIWDLALQGVKEKPLLGWGQGNFGIVFNKYYNPELYAQEPWFDRVHNIILDWAIAGGILGLLAYLSIPLLFLYYLWKEVEDMSLVEKSIFTGLLAGYGFHNLFVFDNLISYVFFFTILAYIHSKVGKPFTNPKWQMLAPSRGVVIRIVVPAVIVLTFISIYAFNAKGVGAAETLIKAISPQEEGLTKNIEYFEETIALNTLGRQEVVEQLITAAVRIKDPSVQFDSAQKQQFFEFARTEMEKLLEKNPNDARTQLFFASFLNRFGYFDDAIVRLEKARELSPKKQAILFELGTSYINKGQTTKALEVFKEAYELAPKYKDATYVYAVGAAYAGRNDIVDKLIADLFAGYKESGKDFNVDNRIVDTYARLGRYDKIIEIFNSAIAINPNNKQHHLSLAATYLQVGRRFEAITEIRKVMELDIGFKEQGEYYISEIEAGRNP